MAKKPTDDKGEPTRYERVKRILDQANQGSTSDYGGQGEFWNLPYEKFLCVEVVGVRMIAPPTAAGSGPPPAPGTGAPPAAVVEEAAGGDCCGGGDSAKGSGGDCCGGGSAPAGAPDPGRGARSGLIQALQGRFPFDGSHFPPFTWGGGKRVEPSDIRFIEGWIDDGCPRTDDAKPDDGGGDEPDVAPWEKACGEGDPGGAGDRPPIRLAALSGVRAGDAVNGFHHAAGNPKIRKNAEALTEQEACRFRYAVGELMKLDRFPQDNRSYSAWARVHGDHCQHGWEQFLPWHRAYLYRFEKAIQAVVPDVTLPYWDWTMPRYDNGAVPAKRKGSRRKPQSGVVPSILRCFVDSAAIDNLSGQVTKNVLDKLKRQVNDGGLDPAKLYNSTWELFWLSGLGRDDYEGNGQPVIAQLQRANPLWHPLRYPGMFYDADANGTPQWKDGQPVLSAQSLTQFHHHYPTAEEIEQILALDTWHDFGGGHYANQSFGILSQNPHNTGHIWSGGENPFFDAADPDDPSEPQFGSMFVDLVAFFDPVAYHHHSNVDRLWAEWQKTHPAALPDDLTASMNPFHLTVEQVLSTTKLGYEYATDARAWPVDPAHEVTRLHTEPAGFHPAALDEPSRADLYVHNVRRAVSSYWVRVFLNQPDADASTPTEGNDHYVGYFGRFGHGPCIGGPGHCEPPRTPLPFEIPARDHNTPQTYRLDATRTVRKLVEKGATDLQVHLVVVHGNGGAPEGLKLDGVSLHLRD